MPTDNQLSENYDANNDIDELSLEQLEIVMGGVTSPRFLPEGPDTLEDFVEAIAARSSAS